MTPAAPPASHPRPDALKSTTSRVPPMLSSRNGSAPGATSGTRIAAIFPNCSMRCCAITRGSPGGWGRRARGFAAQPAAGLARPRWQDARSGPRPVQRRAIAPAVLTDRERTLLTKLQGHAIDHRAMPEEVRLECPGWAAAPLRRRFQDSFQREMAAMLGAAPARPARQSAQVYAQTMLCARCATSACEPRRLGWLLTASA